MEGGGVPSQGEFIISFQADGELQRAHLVSAFSQLLSAQNNPYARAVYLGSIF